MKDIPRPVQDVVAVAGADVVIAPANSNRKGLWISNTDGAASVWVSINKPATVKGGILLAPNTRPVRIAHALDALLCAAEFHAIASAACNVVVWSLEA